ncbi:TetR/AcrR family transcriptional regulator C-terminal domain-containing protein [Bifidobacterium avesanii]|uniref:TetR/AcrR family transcriptional regulator C-terminal domain-containing protein n=1 Tax=Bifidobacterium avesanii TaxID=1798157 RepID=UPI00147873AD
MTPRATWQALLYIRADAAFFDAVSQSGQNMQMYNETKETLKKLIEERAQAMGIRPSLGGIPLEYSGEIVVSGITSLIWMWVRRGFKESPEEITKYIEASKRMSPMALMR